MKVPDKNNEAFGEALLDHARSSARRAREALAAPLGPDNLEKFLSDNRCLRYRTEIYYSREGLEGHQFAQPIFVQSDGGMQCRLHVDPLLRSRQDVLYIVVAYMAAVVNYGAAASPALAELYGSLLTGIEAMDFYKKVCAIAQDISLPPRHNS